MKRVLPYTSFTVAVLLLVLCMAAQAATPDNEGKEVFPLLSICIILYISSYHFNSFYFKLVEKWTSMHLAEF